MMVGEDLCETEWRRQHVFVSVAALNQHPRSLDEKVPIVEIKPFTKKNTEWCRAKSLAEFYENSKVDELYHDTHKTRDPLSPRTHIYSAKRPSPREVKLTTSDKKSCRFGDTYVILPPPKSTYATGEFLRTKTFCWENTEAQMPPKQGSFISTPRERELTTFEGLRVGASNTCNKQFGFKTASNEEKTFFQEKNLKINGYNFSVPGRYELNPHNYSLYRAYTMPLENNQQECFLTKRPEPETKHRREGKLLFGHLASRRSSTSLPHMYLDIHHNTNQQQNDVADNDRTKGTQSSRKTTNQSVITGYRLGGIQNSLEILGDAGKPATIEQHITNELKSTLSKLRRTNYSQSTPPPSIASNHQIVGQIRSASGALTQGEMMLREARYANSITSPQKRGHIPTRSETRISTISQRAFSHNHNRNFSRATSYNIKNENHDSGIQSPINDDNDESDHAAIQQQLLKAEVNSKLKEHVDSEQNLTKKARAVSAPVAMIPSDMSLCVDSVSQKKQGKTSVTSRETPVRDTPTIDTPVAAVCQTPVIPEETEQ